MSSNTKQRSNPRISATELPSANSTTPRARAVNAGKPKVGPTANDFTIGNHPAGGESFAKAIRLSTAPSTKITSAIKGRSTRYAHGHSGPGPETTLCIPKSNGLNSRQPARPGQNGTGKSRAKDRKARGDFIAEVDAICRTVPSLSEENPIAFYDEVKNLVNYVDCVLSRLKAEREEYGL